MSEQRKQVIVKRKFQHNLALVITLSLFVFINVLFVAGYFIIESFSDISQLKQILAYAIAATEITALLVVYRISIIESHRIAGPVFVLERSLRQVKEGDLSFTMRLRAKDHFHETRDRFNETLEELRTRIEKAQTLSRALQEKLPPESEARTLAETLARELGYYRTQPGQKEK